MSAEEQNGESQSANGEHLRTAFNGVSTPLHKVLNDLWGLNRIDEPVYLQLAENVRLDSARKTKTGFEVTLDSGQKITWSPYIHKVANEKITGPKNGFDQAAAAAMIALADAHGWKKLQVTGKAEHKELLWLAVQRQNVRDKEAFDIAQKEGRIPPDENGNPRKFVPIEINFAPLPDSAVYRQWQAEKPADRKADSKADEPGPEVKEDNKGSGPSGAAKNAMPERTALPPPPLEGEVVEEAPKSKFYSSASAKDDAIDAEFKVVSPSDTPASPKASASSKYLSPPQVRQIEPPKRPQLPPPPGL